MSWESFVTVAGDIAKEVIEASVEAAKKEVSKLPEKIGELTEVESLPDKIELLPEDVLPVNIPKTELPRTPENPLPHPESSKVADAEENDYPSTYKERIDRTPAETGERGEWTGERGESTYIPSDEEIRQILEQYGLDGIDYKDGIPDFSKCSECTVEIDNMTEKRYGKDANFQQCDTKCAEQWNKEGRNGKTDWTARDVEKWRTENGYSWHERNDMKTCDLIPTKINDYFGHLGGVAECQRRDALSVIGGDFDD